MRGVKIFAVVVGAVVLLVAGAAAVLLATFDPNEYKDYATRWAEQRTGRSLAIRDDLNLQLFPSLAIETGGIEVGNAPGFGEEPFATIERAAAEVKLWPLLSRRIELGTIRVEGLRLGLATNADGRGNWEDLLEAGAARAEPEPEPEPRAEPGSPDWLETLDVAGVRLQDSSVTLRDPGALRYAIENITLSSGRLRAGEPVDVTAAFELRDLGDRRSLGVDAHTSVTLAQSGVELRGTNADLRFSDDVRGRTARGRLTAGVVAAPAAGPLQLTDTRLDATVTGAAAGGEDLDVGAGWNAASFDPDSGALRIDGLSMHAGDLRADWRLEARDLLGAPQLEGTVTIAAAPAAQVLELLQLTAPPGIAPGQLGTFDLSAGFRASLTAPPSGAEGASLALDSLDLDDVAGTWRGMRLTGNASLTEGRRLDARLAVPAFTADDTLRAIVAANLPVGLDATALQRLALSAHVESDLDTGSTALRDVEAELLGAQVSGDLEVVPQKTGPLYRGEIKTSRFAAESFAAFLGTLMSDKIAPKELGTLSLDTQFSYDSGSDSASLEPLTFEAFGLAASGTFSAKNVTGTAILEGHARVPAFSPRDLLRRFGQAPPTTSDSAVLQRASITTDFAIDGGRGRFTNMTLVLDDSRITGDFTVAGVQNPDYSFTLAIDDIDADRYLPPPESQAAPGAATAGDIELPADALGRLKLDGNVSVGRLTLANLQLDDVATDVQVRNGEAHLTKAGAALYGGRFDGRFDVKAAGEKRGLALTGRAAGLDLAAIIAALTRKEANFSGKGDFDLSLEGRGATVIENVRSAGGRVAFSLQDGAIEGFNLGRSLCAVYNSTQKLPAPPSDLPKRTRYQVISGTASVADGVASSSDLLARAAFMDVTGKGQLKLVEQQLDYSLEAKLTGRIDIPNCQSMQSLIGESIPLTLRGTVTDPAIRPDFSEIIQRRLKDELQKRLQDRIQDRLKGLLQ